MDEDDAQAEQPDDSPPADADGDVGAETVDDDASQPAQSEPPPAVTASGGVCAATGALLLTATIIGMLWSRGVERRRRA